MNYARFAMPLVNGRGAGLGNEMIVWGKAFIAAQALGLRTLHPAWGLNERGYARYFGTSRGDWILHRALQTALPFFRFDDAERLRHGGDFESALRVFAVLNDFPHRGPVVLGLHGMGGGYGQLEPARDFLRAKLLSTRGTLSNLHALYRRINPTAARIGLHVRRGDFGQVTSMQNYTGRFNVTIPLEWFIEVATNLHRTLGNTATFIVVSDASAEELAPLTRAVPCQITHDQNNRDVSDLLALAGCDFMLCSISSYSLWAAFLSETRYGWFAPNLTSHGGLGSIWGHEPNEQVPGSATLTALQTAQANWPIVSRGIAIGAKGLVPAELIEYLRQRAALRRRDSDLLHFGVTPLP